jgi:hypothetical protein
MLLEGLKISARGNTPTDMVEITESAKVCSTPGDDVISNSTIIDPMNRIGARS